MCWSRSSASELAGGGAAPGRRVCPCGPPSRRFPPVRSLLLASALAAAAGCGPEEAGDGSGRDGAPVASTGAAGEGAGAPGGAGVAGSTPRANNANGDDLAHRRRALVAELEEKGIEDRRVLDAIARVPRHEFVPPEYRGMSYEDRALPIAEGQTISRPADVALMLELLELDGDEKVLEVGTGSGYQAALLGCLAREVYTIEIRKRLKEEAAARLDAVRERGLLRCETLEIVEGDGARGYPPAAPYHAIVVTAASDSVPEDLVDQLRPGGRLIIPVGNRFQELKLVERRADGTTESRIIKTVRYVRLEK